MQRKTEMSKRATVRWEREREQLLERESQILCGNKRAKPYQRAPRVLTLASPPSQRCVSDTHEKMPPGSGFLPSYGSLSNFTVTRIHLNPISTLTVWFRFCLWAPSNGLTKDHHMTKNILEELQNTSHPELFDNKMELSTRWQTGGNTSRRKTMRT